MYNLSILTRHYPILFYPILNYHHIKYKFFGPRLFFFSLRQTNSFIHSFIGLLIYAINRSINQSVSQLMPPFLLPSNPLLRCPTGRFAFCFLLLKPKVKVKRKLNIDN